MAQEVPTRPGKPKQGSPLFYFLAFVFVLFVGILIFAYAVTRRTHPIYVDEHGQPTNQQDTTPQAKR